MILKNRGGSLLRGALAVGAFLALEWIEQRQALRARTEPKGRHTLRNLGVAGASAVAIQLAERPVVAPLARWVDRHGFGLLPRLRLPRWAEAALAVILLDYGLYLWHIALHRVPLLWRAHADLDLDTSTALRFHFAELLASVPVRAAQIALLGVRPGPLAAWQTLTICSVMFHHSNVRLPLSVERGLARLVMTPRLHGIHHSVVEREADSNYSSGLTVWDRLHGTYRANVPQDAITIGVPAYRDPDEVTLPRVLAMPFSEEKEPMWRLPDGTRPGRVPPPAPRDHLLP